MTSAKECDAAGELYLHVFAPVLLEYVTWVLRAAVHSGKKRLYFLARDGYQMYLAARKLSAAWKLDIDCRYLKVSRYSVRVPEYFLRQEQCLDRICIGGMDVTFEKIMQRAALTREEGQRSAELAGYGNRYRQVMSYREILALKESLKREKRFLSYVYGHSKLAYPLAMGYFRQEGLLEDVPYAFVDSGWTGTLQQSIQNLLATEKPGISLEGYYFGLYEIPEGESVKQYHSFYFSFGSGLKRKVYFSNCLFEAVFSAPQGMTVGYRKEEDKYLPVMDSAEGPNGEQLRRNTKLLEAYLEKYVELVSHEAFAKGMLTRGRMSGGDRKQGQMSEKLLKRCMARPSGYELIAYGKTLFSDDVLEDAARHVASELSEEDMRNQRFWNKALIMLGWKKGTIHESAWIEGSIVQNGGHVRCNLRHAALYKYFVYIRKALTKKR